mgnify:CR=1 FL=1
MIFFAGNDGTIVKTQPSHVYQGSANTNDIFLVAPFAADCAVTLAFCLPNGVHTPLVAMIPQKEIEGVFSEDGRVFSGWSYTLPSNITRYYGVVSVQFYFYSAQEGVITATGSSSFTVEKGTGAVLPETPTQTIYESILSGISALSQELHNGSYCSRSIYAWNEVAIYGANEIVFCANAREYGAFVRSKVDDNKGNQPFSDNEINAEFWEEVVDFDQISTAYMDNLKQVLEDGADLVKAQADAAAASAELAKKYAEMGIIPNTDYASFEELPTEGSTKFIYLIASPTESESDYYEEYIWVPNRKKYEYIGSTRLDLSDYAKVNGTYAQMSVGKATSAETAQKDADGTLFSEKYVTKTQFAVTDSKVSEHLSDKNNPHTVTKAQIGLSAVENVRQYSAQNPPPYPVTSVDGATGAVELSEKYQKTLTAGSNITIIDDVISATAGSDPVAVKFTEQSLSDAEKLQARTNINAQQAGDYALIDGTYAAMSVGHATSANTAVNDIDMNPIVSTYAKQNGTYAGLNVGYATRATRADNDGNGDSIADTYVKKVGTYPDLTVGFSNHASEADAATNDSDGNKISDTYAKKTDTFSKMYFDVLDVDSSFGTTTTMDQLAAAMEDNSFIDAYVGKDQYPLLIPNGVKNTGHFWGIKKDNNRATFYYSIRMNSAGTDTRYFVYDWNSYYSNNDPWEQVVTNSGAPEEDKTLPIYENSKFTWKWVFNAITDDYSNIVNGSTNVKYFRIPYNSTQRLTVVYAKKNSSGSSALFENITFPTGAKFQMAPIVFTTYYGNSSDTGQIENMYGWVRGDKVSPSGFTARSYGGKGFAWLAIGFSTKE